jgi:hypothetical protein
VAPAAGALEADFLESPAMGVFVAFAAGGERGLLVARPRRAGNRLVTFLAGHRLVASAERKSRCGMMEARRRLPAVHRMAAAAFRAGLAPVAVLEAGRAPPPQTEEKVVAVPNLDFGAVRSRDLALVVALLAIQAAVFSLQRETGLGGVVEAAAVQAHEGELRTVVFRVAAYAVGLRGGRLEGPRVKPGARLHPVPDLGVALQAPEAAFTDAEFVTRRTLQVALPPAMRPREGPGRDLGQCGNAAGQD